MKQFFVIISLFLFIFTNCDAKKDNLAPAAIDNDLKITLYRLLKHGCYSTIGLNYYQKFYKQTKLQKPMDFQNEDQWLDYLLAVSRAKFAMQSKFNASSEHQLGEIKKWHRQTGYDIRNLIYEIGVNNSYLDSFSGYYTTGISRLNNHQTVMEKLKKNQNPPTHYIKKEKQIYQSVHAKDLNELNHCLNGIKIDSKDPLYTFADEIINSNSYAYLIFNYSEYDRLSDPNVAKRIYEQYPELAKLKDMINLERDYRNDKRLLIPYQKFALSLGKDHDGFYMGFALYHQNKTDAENNIDRIWSKLKEAKSYRLDAKLSVFFDLNKCTMQAKSNILSGRFYFTEDQYRDIWYTFLVARDHVLFF